MENWADCAPRLAAVYRALLRKERRDAFEIDSEALASPLPRAFQFLDGSVYLHHMARPGERAAPQCPRTSKRTR